MTHPPLGGLKERVQNGVRGAMLYEQAVNQQRLVSKPPPQGDPMHMRFMESVVPRPRTRIPAIHRIMYGTVTTQQMMMSVIGKILQA